jgi:hypothetical protein
MTDSETPAALAARIDELRGAIARLQAIVAKWDGRLDEGIGEMMVLRLEVKHLSESLDEALSKRRLKPPPAPWWLGLSRDEYAARLAELQEWVERFACVQYPEYLAKLPPCWVNHPAAVWELSTLMTEWRRVYGDKDNRDLSAALWWHERWLPGVIARLVKAIHCDETGCRRARRRESGP